MQAYVRIAVRTKKVGTQVQLKEKEILGLCQASREILQSQPMLLELEAPVRICGDIHGQYYDLLRIFDTVDADDCRNSKYEHGFPPIYNYLFLGDYVDRGKNSLETICLLLAYKILYPENFFLLRGNHEEASINRIYGFYDECKRRYSVKLWKTFTDCFKCLPVAATIEGRIFCCHGGLSPELENLDSINQIPRPTDVPTKGLLCDLLWSDPDRDTKLWEDNNRGVSFTFGEEVVTRFLQQHHFDLICRAHQVVEDGYEFFARRQLVTIFSAPNYCGEFDNAGAMLSVNEELMCNFHVIEPIRKQISYKYKATAVEDNTVSEESESDDNDGSLEEQKQKSRKANQILGEHQNLQKENKEEEEQNRTDKKQTNNQQQEELPEKQDFHQHTETQGNEQLRKEEKKHLNKDHQKHDLKQRSNQKQESRRKGKHLKDQKQEKFTDRLVRPHKMTQTSTKKPTDDKKRSRTQDQKEEEDYESKSSCVIS